MKMTVKEFSALTGVSVRALHYYHEIGLMQPAFVDEENNYRYYDEGSLLRMQEILFYRELDFSLKSIGELLLSPNYDKAKALHEQKQMLTLKKERLERLISAIDGAMKGENIVKAFDKSELETYKAEAKERWGKTEAYKEYENKTAGSTKEQNASAVDGLDAVFAEFADCMKSGAAPEAEGAQALVKKLQDFITANFYVCTKEILAGLGQMYVADERFAKNIDKHTAGTAEFASRAIAKYCK